MERERSDLNPLSHADRLRDPPFGSPGLKRTTPSPVRTRRAPPRIPEIVTQSAPMRRHFWRRLTALTAVTQALATTLSCTEPTAPLTNGQQIAGTGRTSAAIPALPDSMRSWSFSK